MSEVTGILRSDDAVQDGLPVVASGEEEGVAVVSDVAVEMLDDNPVVSDLQRDQVLDDWPRGHVMGALPAAVVELHHAADAEH